jgi:hypothetical protein
VKQVEAVQNLIRLYEGTINADVTASSSSSIVDIFKSRAAQKALAQHDFTENELEPVWISKDWLKEWMKKSPDFGAALGVEDENLANVIDVDEADDKETDNKAIFVLPNDGPYRIDVTCEHGELTSAHATRKLIPGPAWSYFVQNLPGLKEAIESGEIKVWRKSTDACLICTKVRLDFTCL